MMTIPPATLAGAKLLLWVMLQHVGPTIEPLYTTSVDAKHNLYTSKVKLHYISFSYLSTSLSQMENGNGGGNREQIGNNGGVLNNDFNFHHEVPPPPPYQFAPGGMDFAAFRAMMTQWFDRYQRQALEAQTELLDRVLGANRIPIQRPEHNPRARVTEFQDLVDGAISIEEERHACAEDRRKRARLDPRIMVRGKAPVMGQSDLPYEAIEAGSMIFEEVDQDKSSVMEYGEADGDAKQMWCIYCERDVNKIVHPIREGFCGRDKEFEKVLLGEAPFSGSMKECYDNDMLIRDQREVVDWVNDLKDDSIYTEFCDDEDDNYDLLVQALGIPKSANRTIPTS
ncbi:hypothetical protein PR202_gb17193 [Eleusine coracana subsp. coracana]|uniref:Uncharacterized protein n=1 Tax=Eleusine coracana subsp. coracana TaxID=191504 RepID=A0AAV5EZY4_ELECO|nr:hypothetical protein PR202_gb17193 [Eleusine coracana subsp. coracana]